MRGRLPTATSPNTLPVLLRLCLFILSTLLQSPTTARTHTHKQQAVTLEFASVISQLQMIHSTGCVVSCTDTITTVTMDDCAECQFSFPHGCSPSVVHANVRSTNLVAMPAPESQGESSLTHTIEFGNEPAAEEGEEEEQIQQYLTKFEDGIFSTSLLKREGGGYVVAL